MRGGSAPHCQDREWWQTWHQLTRHSWLSPHLDPSYLISEYWRTPSCAWHRGQAHSWWMERRKRERWDKNLSLSLCHMCVSVYATHSWREYSPSSISWVEEEGDVASAISTCEITNTNTQQKVIETEITIVYSKQTNREDITYNHTHEIGRICKTQLSHLHLHAILHNDNTHHTNHHMSIY